jgi:hypothetical protein
MLVLVLVWVSKVLTGRPFLEYERPLRALRAGDDQYPWVRHEERAVHGQDVSVTRADPGHRLLVHLVQYT